MHGQQVGIEYVIDVHEVEQLLSRRHAQVDAAAGCLAQQAEQFCTGIAGAVRVEQLQCDGLKTMRRYIISQQILKCLFGRRIQVNGVVCSVLKVLPGGAGINQATQAQLLHGLKQLRWHAEI